jgi:hypothetical protein
MTPCYNILNEVRILSKWDKLTNDIKKLDRGLRFDELAKALSKIGYT